MKLGTCMNNISIAYANIFNSILLKRKKVDCGKNVQIEGKMYIQGSGGVIIGNNVRLISYLKMNAILPYRGCIVLNTFQNGKITIGSGVGITMSALAARESITIEDDVYIGAGCKIYDNDFHSLNYEERMKNGDNNIICKPIRIKKGAFIGANSIILKGVVIGEKAIVGAGSLVTKSIPDGEIWGGNPARYIKRIE